MDWNEMVEKTEKDCNSDYHLSILNGLPSGSKVEYKDHIYIKTNLTPFYCDIDNGNMKKVEHLLVGIIKIIRRGEG